MKENDEFRLEKSILKCSKAGNLNELKDLDKKWGQRLLKWRHPRSGETVLSLCSRNGCIASLEYLVNHCDQGIEQQNNDGKRALHEAALGGHFECVKFLIKENVEVDSLKRADWTPLMLACTKNNLNIIVELIRAGANPKLVNKDGWNSFHIAVREGHENIVQYLLGIASDIWDTVSNNGRTPLHTAALHGHLQTVSLLLKHGNYKTDCGDSCGTTPLMDAFKGSHIGVASLLVSQHGSDVRAMDNLGRQCVDVAAQSGSMLSLKFLMNEHSVNVNDGNDNCGMTALHIAAKEGHFEAVSFLLDQGSNINCQDKNGRTALHLSSAAGQTKTVEVLLKSAKINIHLQDKDGQTAQDFALKQDLNQLFQNNLDKSSKIS